MKVNDVEMSTEEALEVLKAEGTVINKVSFGIENKDKKLPLSNDGFVVAKEFVADLSKAMERAEGAHIIARFMNSSKINGKNFYIILANPDAEINKLLEDA